MSGSVDPNATMHRLASTSGDVPAREMALHSLGGRCAGPVRSVDQVAFTEESALGVEEQRPHWAVCVADHGTDRQRPVTVGHCSTLAAQMLTGLKGGEMVITHPDNTITGGAGGDKPVTNKTVLRRTRVHAKK
jgi:hypothetical protein